MSKELSNLPHNMLRKVFALKSCISSLESLQRRYKPIFDEDQVINSLLEQMRTEEKEIMDILRQREDAIALFEEC